MYSPTRCAFHGKFVRPTDLLVFYFILWDSWSAQCPTRWRKCSRLKTCQYNPTYRRVRCDRWLARFVNVRRPTDESGNALQCQRRPAHHGHCTLWPATGFSLSLRSLSLSLVLSLSLLTRSPQCFDQFSLTCSAFSHLYRLALAALTNRRQPVLTSVLINLQRCTRSWLGKAWC